LDELELLNETVVNANRIISADKIVMAFINCIFFIEIFLCRKQYLFKYAGEYFQAAVYTLKKTFF